MATFETWYEKINSKYLKSRAGLSTGLNCWFNRLRDGKGFSEDTRKSVKEFCRDYNVGGDDEKSANKKLAMVAIAKSFYLDEYAYYQKRGNFSSKGLFDSEKNYTKTLKEYFDNDETSINFSGFNKESFKIGRAWYWLEIASALQKQFKVFTSVEDVNQFIRYAGKLDTGRWLLDYGFYVRNVVDLCLAYSILHEYSAERAYDLVNNAKTVLTTAQKETGCGKVNLNKTETQNLTNAFSTVMLATNVDNEKDFLALIASNCDKLVISDAKTHWSAIKSALWSVKGFGENLLSENWRNKMEEWQKYHRDVEERIEKIFDSLYENGRIKKGNELILDEGTLAHYLSTRLGMFEDEYTDAWTAKMLNGPIRCLYIVSLMKDLYDENAHSAIFAINHINTKLQSVALRGIELNATNSSIDECFDTFDWFVAQCIKYEEDNPLYDDEVVAGYETFIGFLAKSMEEELGKE